MTEPKRVRLAWTGEGHEFRGTGGWEAEALMGGTHPGPMDSLLLSVAGCMGIDVLVILERSRVPVHDLTVAVEGRRAEEHPRRYTAISIEYTIHGPGPEHQKKLDRAIALSRDKYCSVLHSLREDIQIDVRINPA